MPGNSVNINTSALSARRYLDAASTQLGRAQNQLSSGLKASDPSDDPSSSAIASILTSTISALAQAANNGIQASSLIQLATGTLKSTSDILTRLATLAAQANSDSIDDSARQMLDKEYQALISQIDNNAQVSWGDVNLFTGTSGTINGTSYGSFGTGGPYHNAFDILAVSTQNPIYGIGGNKATFNGIDTISMVVGDTTFTTSLSTSQATNDFNFTTASGDYIKIHNSSANVSTSSNALAALNGWFDQDTVIANSGSGNGSVGSSGRGVAYGMANQISGAFVGYYYGIGVYINGFVSGLPSNLQVKQSASNYDVSIMIGNQKYVGTTVPQVGGILTLTSTTDGANNIQILYDQTSIYLLTDVNALKNNLEKLFGLDKGVPATIQPASAGMVHAQLIAGATADAGDYALSYTANGLQGTFKLTDGIYSYTAQIPAQNTVSQDVSFDNGMTVRLFNFDGTTNVGQSTYHVGTGNTVNMIFQVGQKTSDVINVNFKGMSALALGLAGTNITTKEDAGQANSAIIQAQKSVNNLVASLGGKKSQLERLCSNLDVSIQNELAAKATFSDVEITDALMDLEKFQAIAKSAVATFQKTLERNENLVRVVESIVHRAIE